MPDRPNYHGRCLAGRCGFKVEGKTEAEVEKALRAHVKAIHSFLGAAIEIERPVMTWTPEDGWRDAG